MRASTSTSQLELDVLAWFTQGRDEVSWNRAQKVAHFLWLSMSGNMVEYSCTRLS